MDLIVIATVLCIVIGIVQTVQFLREGGGLQDRVEWKGRNRRQDDSFDRWENPDGEEWRNW